MDRDDPAYTGQSEYTPFFLRIYDPVILGIFTRFIWRCPTSRMVEPYRPAMNGVIHCLPSPLSRKAEAVANVAAVLAPDGVFFGSTILGISARHNRPARGVLKRNNQRGIFDNLDDTEEGLREILEASFEQVELETVGSMAIFTATGPRSNGSADRT